MFILRFNNLNKVSNLECKNLNSAKTNHKFIQRIHRVNLIKIQDALLLNDENFSASNHQINLNNSPV